MPEQTSEPPTLSLIVPVFDEQESLAMLLDEILTVATAQFFSIEVIFIDDGSRDGSWRLIRELAATDVRVRGLRFRRNFGKAAALQAGFQAARGCRIITLDADLQDDPKEIPNFLRILDDGNDLVVGWKKVRHDPWHKVFPSHVFNGVVSFVTGVKLHDHNCGMKAYTAALVKEIHLYGEMHRFVPILADARGFRVAELVIHHRPRKFGRSKYGVRRFLRASLDLLTVKFLTIYGRRPMHIFGAWSLGVGLISLLAIAVGLFWFPAISSSTLCALFGLALAVVMFLHGLQAEMIAFARPDNPFSIAERVGFEEIH